MIEGGLEDEIRDTVELVPEWVRVSTRPLGFGVSVPSEGTSIVTGVEDDNSFDLLEGTPCEDCFVDKTAICMSWFSVSTSCHVFDTISEPMDAASLNGCRSKDVVDVAELPREVGSSLLTQLLPGSTEAQLSTGDEGRKASRASVWS